MAQMRGGGGRHFRVEHWRAVAGQLPSGSARGAAADNPKPLTFKSSQRPASTTLKVLRRRFAFPYRTPDGTASLCIAWSSRMERTKLDSARALIPWHVVSSFT